MKANINKPKTAKLNISSNPAIAYQQGLNENTMRGFIGSNNLFLIAYHNVIDDYVKTHKTQCALINAIEAEMNRLYSDEFTEDLDKIAVALRRVNEVRRKFKMED